jgi:haloalkane dehalogenase
VSALYPFAAHWLETPAGRMHYVDEGSGAPVLMVHGNPSWSFYWRELIAGLRGVARAIAPDHIGCGRSDKPGADRYRYTLATRVEDLARLIRSLDLHDLTLVLHDWGTMIGMAWAVRHPERVARIVVLNGAAFPLPSTKRFPAALALARIPGLGAALVRGANLFARGAVRTCVTRRPMSAAVAAGYLEPYASWAERVAVHRFVLDIPLRPGDPAWPILCETADRLDVLASRPMLVAWGMRDFVFDRHFLDEWTRRFPAAEVHRFEDCGHYVLEDAAEEIVPLVRRFLRTGLTDAANP